MSAKRSPRTNRRYYLHQVIKKKYKYNALGHVVFLGCDEEADRYVKELQNEFGYAVQLEIR